MQAHGIRQASFSFRAGGQHTAGASPSATIETVFLLASLTKPMTATAVMKLVDRGQLKLNDLAKKYLPELAGGQRASITIKHLLTHTSGLPDMLPENDALRRRHAPLREWVALACRTPLLFTPGTEGRYQSMGILLAAEIVERVAKQPLPDFLSRELFAPFGMKATTLGLGPRALASTAPSQVTGNDDWNWNSPYWRKLGAPWGGALAPVAGVVAFVQAFLQPERQSVLKVETARAMVTDQNAGLNLPWGIGWAVNSRPRPDGGFGKGCSPRAFGHSGSTGTLCWADPASDRVFVILTTKPAAESNQPVLHPLSDLASI